VIAATRALQMDAGLPIDYDHATDFGAPEGRPAPAAGWICDLEDRDGALWGKVEWTAHGADAVAMREYRYISPVFEYAKSGEVVRLLRAALTNNPNLYLTAISAKSVRPCDADERGNALRAGLDNENMETFQSDLQNLLGLSAESKPDELLAAVRALAEKKQIQGERAAGEQSHAAGERVDGTGTGTDSAHYVPVAQFEKVLTELNRLQAARSREQAEKAVENAARDGRLSPAQRDWAISYCQADPSGFARFIANQSPLLTIAARTRGADVRANQINQRSEEAVTNERAAAGLTRVETAICAHLGIKPREYIGRKAGASDFLALN
jgi:phage I-like protein